MIKFIVGYVLGHHREARTGCGFLLIFLAAIVISFGMIITGNT